MSVPASLSRESAAAQLSRLAAAGRTGVLTLAGDQGGAIHLLAGAVVAAESRGAPGPADRLAQWPAGPGQKAPSPFERGWVIREATVDAAVCLLSAGTRGGRFRAAVPEPATAPGPDVAAATPVADLLAEVRRRQAILGQMSAVLTADTTVATSPRLSARAVHVSAAQWALLVRMGGPCTPRGLALRSGRSVFGTTVEAFRLLTLGLVAVIGAATPAPGGDGPAGPVGRGRIATSFLRAAAV